MSRSWIIMSRNSPPESRDIGGRRRRGVATDDGQQFHRADLARIHPPFQRTEMRIEAAVESDHQHHARLPHRCQTRTHPVHREIDRLLAEDRPPGGGGAFDVVGVRGRGRANQHRIGGECLIQRQRARAA